MKKNGKNLFIYGTFFMIIANFLVPPLFSGHSSDLLTGAILVGIIAYIRDIEKNNS